MVHDYTLENVIFYFLEKERRLFLFVSVDYRY
jgi:hypothetical protein